MKNLTILFAILGILAIGALAQDVNLAQGFAADTLREWVNGWNTTNIPYSGTPSCLLTFGPDSYPVFQTDAAKCGTFGAAARAGLGRIAAFGHNGYPGLSPVLDKNVKTWLAQGAFNTTQILSFDRISESQFLAANLSNYKFISWTGPQNFSSPDSLNKIEAYVRNGGGLLAAYPGWVLTSYNGYACVNDAPMNKLLNRFGIVLTGSYLGGNAPAPTSVPSVQNLNAFYAVQANLTLATQQTTLEHAVEVVPIQALDSISLIYTYLNNVGLTPVTFPIKAGNYKAKISVQYLAKKYDNVENPKAMNGIDVIPGVVPTTDRISAVVTAVREISDSWISTGYYLAAGEVLTVTAQSPSQNWHVRIGCHSDGIAHKDNWPRNPFVTKQVKLNGTTTRVTSPFGGLIYLVSSGSSCTNITVKLENVVEAPFFDLNNPNSVWNVNAPGPVAEIQGKFLTMSVPTRYVKGLTDPAAVAQFWDRIVGQDHVLRGSNATRRERFVADVEISAGYMHSGYPIMTYLDVVTPPKNEKVGPQLNVSKLTIGGSWGHYHEVGHNMQRGWWTIEGTGEVTNNVFSLWGGYLSSNFPALQNPWLKGKVNTTTKGLNSYLLKSNEEAYSWYKSDPGVFLVQYAMIQHYFGWEAYSKVFASYEVPNGPRPSSNQDKIDTWVKQLSIAVGRNLLPYYEMWKMPISEKGVSAVNALGLPAWMPGNQDYGISWISQDYLNSIRTKYNL